jgi:branched-subunit amino acid transport protein
MSTTWIVIVALAVGTYLIRLSFLGLIGNRDLPPWVLRHLRYTPVAVLPAIVTPLVLFPQATDGHPDPARLLAAAATVLTGLITKSVFTAIVVGAVVLYTALWAFG